MPQRFHTGEKLLAATRAQIPTAAIKWLAAIRTPLEKLTIAATTGQVTEAEFQALVRQFSASLPSLLGKMDHSALATLMEAGMGAALANGYTARHQPPEDKNQKTQTAKLPWETAPHLAAQKRKNNGQFGEGNGMGEGGSELANGIPEFVKSPTGRTVEMCSKLAAKAEKWKGRDPARLRFAQRAVETLREPDEVWQHGTFVTHVKSFKRLSLVVHTRRTGEKKEVYQSHIPMSRGREKTRGQKIWPL